MEDFGKFCAALLVLIFSSLIGGYVFKTLWDWFIVTAFNAPTFSLATAIGLRLLLGYVFTQKREKKPEENATQSMLKSFSEGIVLALFVLGIGWIIYQFV